MEPIAAIVGRLAQQMREALARVLQQAGAAVATA